MRAEGARGAGARGAGARGPGARARLRRLALGLPAALGFGGGAFLIPHRHAGAAVPGPCPVLEPLFRAAEPAMRELLAAMVRHRPGALAAAGPAPAPRFEQDWFPRLDALAAYALMRERRPARLVEVGSGHSTRWLAAAARDGAGTAITCVDPAPRAPLNGLGVRVERRLLARDDPALRPGALGPGDALFVDSSHVAMPGTDVDLLLLDAAPRLPPGALLHVHDVFLPDPYPESWAWRGYNEQMIVAAMLQGGAWRVLWSSRWAATRMAAEVGAAGLGALPLPAGAHESSLWLEKTGPALGWPRLAGADP